MKRCKVITMEIRFNHIGITTIEAMAIEVEVMTGDTEIENIIKSIVNTVTNITVVDIGINILAGVSKKCIQRLDLNMIQMLILSIHIMTTISKITINIGIE